MADLLIVRECLTKADEDFGFAETNLTGGSEFYAQISFHFQQAAEKYLKAYIICKGLGFDKVHHLVHILKTCSAFEPAFDVLREDCILLNTAYIESRYPVSWPTSYTKETAERSRTAALNIARMVRTQLGMSIAAQEGRSRKKRAHLSI